MNKVKETLLANLRYAVPIGIILLLLLIGVGYSVMVSVLIWTLLEIAYVAVKLDDSTSNFTGFFLRLLLRVALVTVAFILFLNLVCTC